MAWGPYYGGDTGGVDLTNVMTIVGNEYTFAALKTDGTVVTWGGDSAVPWT